MTSESNPQVTDPIAARQRRIYRISFWCSAGVLFLWMPIIFLVEPGTNIRPMFQMPCSLFLILPLAAVNVFRGIKQLRITWPERAGFTALLVSLVPILHYALLQWILLGHMGVTFGS